MIYPRQLNLSALIQKKSHFLFGPRSTGKTFLIEHQLPKAKVYNLLDSDIFARLLRRPKLLSEEVSHPGQLIVIDEIQKLPSLLDEVQRLMTSKQIRFLLTGSSARKLKRGGANLLGGRAWEARLFPLSYSEIPDFSLLTYFNCGGLPSIYSSPYFQDELKNYVNLYLREEILAEALVRKLESFTRFLDTLALNNGEELNFEGLSSDSGVPARTLENYIRVLEDTLFGFQAPPFGQTKKRKAITRSKFYFFDIGIVNHLAQRGEIKEKSELFGKCFEHFLMLELRAYLSYRNSSYPLQYWRSTSGFEVDAIVGKKMALEFKATDLVSEKHLKGLSALKEEKMIDYFAVVSLDPVPRKIHGISICPWQDFLKNLWADKLPMIDS